MKILITGFSGYLGNSFLEVLKKKIGKNDQVFCISSKVIKKKNKLFKYKTLNLNNYKKTNQFIMDFRPDILFHFAWYVEHKDYLCSQKNFSSLNFSNNLYEIFCKLGGKKAFFFGTNLEFDPYSRTYSEREVTRKNHCNYSLSKFKFYKSVLKISQKYKSEFAWIRVFFSYGSKKENRLRLVPQLIEHYFSKKDYTIRHPEKIVNIMHVKDMARAIYLIYSKNIVGIVNLASYNSVKISQIKDLVYEKISRVFYVKSSKNTSRIELNKLKKINFREKITLSRGIKEMKENYK